MARDSKSKQPSLLYVFVVLSLAAFLLLFTIWRDPGISYETAATFQTKSTPQALRDRLLRPRFVLDALHQAEMIDSSSTVESLTIAAEIARRMNVKVAADGDLMLGQLTLVSSHPQAALRLLDSMLREAAAEGADDVISYAVQPAAVARIRGGSVTPGTLALLSAGASVFGFGGVHLARRARACSLLYTSREVKQVVRVPVVADFADANNFPERERQMSRRRLASVVVRAAELTVAVVFAIMVYQLTTRDAFPTRFLQDPLAAYGEVLTRLIG